MFFGKLKEYLKSDFKVVTVGLNPSDQEFLQKDKINPLNPPRFKYSNTDINNKNIKLYIEALSEYFEINPYNNWFDRNLEKIMNEMGVSFYSNKKFKNRALHTDICSPLATNPTWGNLSEKDKSEFKAHGYKIWLKLIKLLKPNIILISVSEKYLKEYDFINPKILRNKSETTFRKSDVYNKGVNLNTKNIKLYEHKEIKNLKIFKGRNNSGNPFGNISYKRGDKEIKLVSILILNNSPLY